MLLFCYTADKLGVREIILSQVKWKLKNNGHLETAGPTVLELFQFMGEYFSKQPSVSLTEVLLFWYQLETEVGRTWDENIEMDLFVFLIITKCV